MGRFHYLLHIYPSDDNKVMLQHFPTCTGLQEKHEYKAINLLKKSELILPVQDQIVNRTHGLDLDIFTSYQCGYVLKRRITNDNGLTKYGGIVCTVLSLGIYHHL